MLRFTLKERFLSRLNLLPIPLYDVFPSPLFGHIVAAALRLNIFEKLTKPHSVDDLAHAANIHPKTAILLLSSLHTSGYARRIGKRYTLTSLAKKWLLQSSPQYIGNFVRYVELLYAHWLYLEETLASGQPPRTYIESFGEKEWEIYVYGMMDLAKITFPNIATKMALSDEARNFLDLGGSHGFYSLKLCQRYPKLRATIVDFPQVLHFTQKILREQNAADRISLEPGNVLETSLLSKKKNVFDAALAANIVHGLTPEQNRLFLKNSSSAIKSGGQLFILDQFTNKKGSDLEQFIPLMVGINLMNEVGGSVYSLDELEEWCREAGLSNMRVFRLRLPGILLVRFEKTS